MRKGDVSLTKGGLRSRLFVVKQANSLHLQILSCLLLCVQLPRIEGQQVFCPGPSSISCSDTEPVVWEGTLFSGQCPDNPGPDTIGLGGLTTSNISQVFTCGRHNVTVNNVQQSTAGQFPVTLVSSTLLLNADPSIDGLNFSCGTAGAFPAVSINITAPDIPIPTITTSRFPTAVRVTFSVADTRCASVYIAEVTPVGGSPSLFTNSTPVVSVSDLDLCRISYSIVGLVQSPTGSRGARSSSTELFRIGVVDNVRGSGSVLEWTQQRTNSLTGCITGYRISFLSQDIFTDNNNTSIGEVIPGFPYCQTVSVTVAPNTPNGVFTDGSSTSTVEIQHPDFISPTVEVFFVSNEGTVQLKTTSQEVPPALMYCARMIGDCDPSTNDISNFQPNDSYTVFFRYERFNCIDNFNISGTVPPELLRFIAASATESTISVRVGLPSPDSLPLSSDQLSIRYTIETTTESIGYPSDTEYTFIFFGLSEETTHQFDIRIVRQDNSNVVGLPLIGMETTSGCGGPCRGGAAGGAVGGAVAVGVVVSVVVVIVVKKKKSKSNPDVEEQDLTKKTPPPPDSLYADPNAIEHTTAPGSEAQYAMVDRGVKEKKKKKPTQQEALYQDPVTIEHETTATGAEYAVVDKPKRASKKNQGPDVVPPGTNEGGLQYADIDISNKSRAPRSSQRQAQEPVGSVEYSTISTENATMM